VSNASGAFIQAKYPHGNALGKQQRTSKKWVVLPFLGNRRQRAVAGT